MHLHGKLSLIDYIPFHRIVYKGIKIYTLCLAMHQMNFRGRDPLQVINTNSFITSIIIRRPDYVVTEILHALLLFTTFLDNIYFILNNVNGILYHLVDFYEGQQTIPYQLQRTDNQMSANYKEIYQGLNNTKPLQHLVTVLKAF